MSLFWRPDEWGGGTIPHAAFNRLKGMSKEKNVVAAMMDLSNLFAESCPERSTLDELRQMLPDHTHWKKAHDLFDRIRKKTLTAIKNEDQLLEAQYEFEEACTKTLYNLGRHPAPFDPDSPDR